MPPNHPHLTVTPSTYPVLDRLRLHQQPACCARDSSARRIYTAAPAVLPTSAVDSTPSMPSCTGPGQHCAGGGAGGLPGERSRRAHLIVGDLVVLLHQVELLFHGRVARGDKPGLAGRHESLDLVLRALRYAALLEDAAELVEDRVQHVRRVLLQARAHVLHSRCALRVAVAVGARQKQGSTGRGHRRPTDGTGDRRPSTACSQPPVRCRHMHPRPLSLRTNSCSLRQLHHRQPGGARGAALPHRGGMEARSGRTSPAVPEHSAQARPAASRSQSTAPSGTTGAKCWCCGMWLGANRSAEHGTHAQL